MTRSPSTLTLTFVAAIAIAGCSDRASTPVAPRFALTPSYEETALDAGPDSGEVVVQASDGVEGLDGRLRFAALAATVPTIRIGVVQSATSLTLGSAGDYSVTDKANGLVLMTGGGDAVTVNLLQAPPSYYRLQVMCASTSTVAQAKAKADAAGYPTLTEFVPTANCTRLYIGRFDPPPANTFAARTAFRNMLIAAGMAGSDSFWKVVAIGSALYRVTHGAVTIESVDPVVLTSPSAFVTINGATYRGKAEARLNSSGALAGINELSLEQYLYGVVPRELGPIAYPLLEAQKAQAVAARTYAFANKGRRASDGYDLRATTDDQVYGGYGAEYPLSNQAVDETAGLVATSGGQPIDALYSSTSGGHTADNEESFTGTPLPYLRGVPDAERGDAFDHVPTVSVFMAHANPISLRAEKQGDAESDWSRYHRWMFEWTQAELSAIVSSSVGQPVGSVSAVNVLSRGPSGRVLSIEFVTDAGTFTSDRGAIRSFLKYLDASGTPTNLPSTLFYIEPIVDHPSGAIVGYRAYGGGFGHGVGLSQTGAVGLAQHGQDFGQILAHYYQGIELTREY